MENCDVVYTCKKEVRGAISTVPSLGFRKRLMSPKCFNG